MIMIIIIIMVIIIVKHNTNNTRAGAPLEEPVDHLRARGPEVAGDVHLGLDYISIYIYIYIYI